MNIKIDIDENKWSKKILDMLLIDKTSNNNIIWGTDDYSNLGEGYKKFDEIKYHLITGNNSDVIQPRVSKTKESKGSRTKEKAEVFTPSWVCNAQNNLVDNAWFSKRNVFNFEKDKSWTLNKEKIEFPDNKSWKDYVCENRLEITCGEAPYLVSRYDTVTGKPIDINYRIGILDRKIRIVNENVDEYDDWIKWVILAYKSVYGFEYQGDSLLLARENLLASFYDYFDNKFGKEPNEDVVLLVADIVSWNIWQMDGLNYFIPNDGNYSENSQISLLDFDNCINKPQYCIIKDWTTNELIIFKDMIGLNRNEK